MKLTKKKVVATATAVSLVAILSMGTLAWFTDSESAKNEFYFTDSETDDPDEIFSVEVWEDDDEEDPEGDDKHENLEFTNILPGDSIYKEVHIENTGHHDQYIRAIVTVSGARVWQEFYGEYVVDLNKLVKNLTDYPIHTKISYYDAEKDIFVYELYFDKALAAGQEIILFEEVLISEELTQKEAAALNGKFTIDVVAYAVQTRNVGDDVLAAFQTIGEAKTVVVAGNDALITALQDGNVDRVVLASHIDWSSVPVLIKDATINNKVLDFNGQNGTIKFAKTADTTNLIVCGIRDVDGASATVVTNNGFDGQVTIFDCVMWSNDKAISCDDGDITVLNCEIIGVEGANSSKGIYNGSIHAGNLTVLNTNFKNLTGYVVDINSLQGDLTMKACNFENVKGIVRNLGGTTGVKTYENNTRDGMAWPAN